MPPNKGTSKKNKKPRKRGPRPRASKGGNRGGVGSPWSSNPLLKSNEVDVGKIPVFKPSYRCSLRYADNFTLTSTSGAVATYVFAANGLYDPDITGTGHQPAGFDQMMLSYEHYTVLNSRITVTFHNTSTTVAGTVAVSINAGSTPTTISNQLMEDGLISYTRIGQFGVSNAIQTLQRSFNIGRFGGVPNVLDDSSYRGTVASNPAELSYFHVQAWSIELGTFASAVDFVLEFDAVFTEPRKLTESFTRVLSDLLVQQERETLEKRAQALRFDGKHFCTGDHVLPDGTDREEILLKWGENDFTDDPRCECKSFETRPPGLRHTERKPSVDDKPLHPILKSESADGAKHTISYSQLNTLRFPQQSFNAKRPE